MMVVVIKDEILRSSTQRIQHCVTNINSASLSVTASTAEDVRKKGIRFNTDSHLSISS